MRRQTIITSAKRILDDLNFSGIANFVENYVRSGPGREKKEFDLGAFQKYSIAVSTYGDAEKTISNIFELDKLADPLVWSTFISNDREMPLYELHNSIYHAKSFLPKLLKLIEQDRVEKVISQSADIPDILKGTELITIIIPENDDQYSSPLRVSYAIESVSYLYDIFAEIFDKGRNELIIIACDSGSDKSFDFTGVPQIVQSVKETILAIWDRVVFHRHSKTLAEVDIIFQSLPVYEKIKTMEDDKKISPELAEQLRRRTSTAIGKFVETGAIIPEMEAQATQSPRQLMSPERKLLAAPIHSPTPEDELTNAQEEHPSAYKKLDEENAELRSLLREIQRKLDDGKGQPPSSVKRKPRVKKASKPT